MAVAISLSVTRRPGSTTATSRGISIAVVATSSALIRSDIDFDRGFRPDRHAVADITHVDAAIERRGAGIKKRQLEIAVLGPHLAERNADDAAAAFTVERDRGDGAIIDLHFEIALAPRRR